MLAIGKKWYFPRTRFRVSPPLRWLSTDRDAKQRQGQPAFRLLPQQMCWQPRLRWAHHMWKVLPGRLCPTCSGEYGSLSPLLIPEIAKHWYLKGRVTSKIHRAHKLTGTSAPFNDPLHHHLLPSSPNYVHLALISLWHRSYDWQCHIRDLHQTLPFGRKGQAYLKGEEPCLALETEMDRGWPVAKEDGQSRGGNVSFSFLLLCTSFHKKWGKKSGFQTAKNLLLNLGINTCLLNNLPKPPWTAKSIES